MEKAYGDRGPTCWGILQGRALSKNCGIKRNICLRCPTGQGGRTERHKYDAGDEKSIEIN